MHVLHPERTFGVLLRFPCRATAASLRSRGLLLGLGILYYKQSPMFRRVQENMSCKVRWRRRLFVYSSSPPRLKFRRVRPTILSPGKVLKRTAAALSGGLDRVVKPIAYHNSEFYYTNQAPCLFEKVSSRLTATAILKKRFQGIVMPFELDRLACVVKLVSTSTCGESGTIKLGKLEKCILDAG